MPETPRRFISTDIELTDPAQDFFGWDYRARNLATALALPVRPTPFTLGIEGDWGSGKTSFINLALAHLGTLQPAATTDKEAPLADRLACYHHEFGGIFQRLPPSRIYLLKFDSWVFTQSEADVDYLFPLYVVQVLRDFLLASGRLKADAPEAGLAGRMARVLPRVGKGLTTLGQGLADIALPGAGKVIEGLQYLAGSTEMEKKAGEANPGLMLAQLVRFKPDFHAMVQALLAPDTEQQRALDKSHSLKPPYNRFVLVVDDLDRVPPLTAVNITEKIKLFMDVPGCIFILAADLQVIQQGLEKKLGKEVSEEEGKNYLDKIVKIQYQVPPLSRPQVRDILRQQEYQLFNLAFVRDGECDPGVLDLIHAFPMIAENPRSLKRVLNTFDFAMLVLLGTDDDPHPDHSYRRLALDLLDQYDDQARRRLMGWLARQDPAAKLDHDLAARGGLADTLQDKNRVAQKGIDEHLNAYVTEIVRRAYPVAAWLEVFNLLSPNPTGPWLPENRSH
jgi:hypothetical protein